VKTEKIDVTVVICTRNRAAQLASVLDSACKLVIPADLAWEFIVVDNGSNDGTADVVAKYADRLPIRCVREDKAGLSNARNCGVDEAKGDYICWTDDDVVIDPQWLSAYSDAFKRHPEAAVFGGRIIPFLEKPTPDWFESAKFEWPLSALLAYRDFGKDIIKLTFEGGFVPWGANFAIRTKEQRSYRYNPHLGVSPNHKRVGEETDVIYRIFKEGANGWWVPDSKVTHIIPPKRQTFQYLYDYSYLGGETFGYLRDCFPDDNYFLATGSPPEAYSYSNYQIYLKIMIHAIKLAVTTILRRKSKLTHISRIGYFNGIISYKRSI
jgi:glycosyltransferase involved in cell wall biosynthesis